MEKLKLFNVGWECKGKKPPADHHFTTQYHQIGNIRVFAYSAAEAYDHALVELAERRKRSKNIKITIPFVEEVKPKEGVTNEREMQWSDADKYGDWLKQREIAIKVNVECSNCNLTFPVEQADFFNEIVCCRCGHLVKQATDINKCC